VQLWNFYLGGDIRLDFLKRKKPSQMPEHVGKMQHEAYKWNMNNNAKWWKIHTKQSHKME